MTLITTVISVYPTGAYEKATSGGVGVCQLDQDLVPHGCVTTAREKLSEGVYKISVECDEKRMDLSEIAKVMHKHGFTYMSAENAISLSKQSTTAQNALKYEREKGEHGKTQESVEEGAES